MNRVGRYKKSVDWVPHAAGILGWERRATIKDTETGEVGTASDWTGPLGIFDVTKSDDELLDEAWEDLHSDDE